jgi:hypothetical protein
MIREQLTRHVAMDDEGTRGSRLVTAHDDDFIEVLLVTTHRYYSSLLLIVTTHRYFRLDRRINSKTRVAEARGRPTYGRQ